MSITRRQWLWILGLPMVAWFVAFAIPERAMTKAGGPGITEFELVRTADRAAQYMNDWGDAGVNAAKWAVWMDFPFIVLFAAFLSLLMRAAADRCQDRGRPTLERVGRRIWALPIVAGSFDAIEDIGLLAILYGDTGSLAPAVATGFAVAKFALLFVVLAYLVTALVATTIGKPGVDGSGAAKLPVSSGD